jgi:hypothetical protein
VGYLLYLLTRLIRRTDLKLKENDSLRRFLGGDAMEFYGDEGGSNVLGT